MRLPSQSCARPKKLTTSQPSTPLSHINLLAKGWGIPNAYIKNAKELLKQYDGWCTQVSEQEILDAQMSLVHDSGVFVEPASTAAWAALVKDRDMLVKRFGSDVCACVLLTGIGFKDMAVFDGRVSMPASI